MLCLNCSKSESKHRGAAAFWTWNCLKKLVEMFLNTFIGRSVSINDAVKSYREKIVLKTLQLQFFSLM